MSPCCYWLRCFIRTASDICERERENMTYRAKKTGLLQGELCLDADWVLSKFSDTCFVIPKMRIRDSFFVVPYIKKEDAINECEDICKDEREAVAAVSIDILKNVRKLGLPDCMSRILPVTGETDKDAEVCDSICFPGVETLNMLPNKMSERVDGNSFLVRSIPYYKKLFPNLNQINIGNATKFQWRGNSSGETTFYAGVVLYGANVTDIMYGVANPISYCCFPEYRFNEQKKKLNVSAYFAILGGFLLRPDLYNAEQAALYRAVLKEKAAAVMEYAARKERYEFIRAYFQSWYTLTPNGFEKLLKKVQGNTEMQALVIERYRSAYDVEKLRAKREAHAIKLLENPNMAENFRGIYKWRVEPNGDARINKVMTAPDSTLYIPEKIGKRKVVALDEGACAYLGVTKIVVPSSIRSIGEQCFACSSVESIVLSEGVQKIGATAFGSCYNIHSIVFPSSVRSIGRRVLNCCDALEELTVLGPLQTVSGYAFSDCEGLKRVSMPQATFLEGDMFSGCRALKSVWAPAVTRIGYCALARCNSLKTITVGELEKVSLDAFWGCRALEIIYTTGDLDKVKELFYKDYGKYFDGRQVRILKA